MKKIISTLILSGAVSLFAANAVADDDFASPDDFAPGSCRDILDAINANNKMSGSYPIVYKALKAAVDEAIVFVKNANIGLGNDMWATINDRDGVVCAVAFSGLDRGDQWPGSRIISAEKAYTANAYSLNGFAVSTANLYASNLDGGGFMGLQFSNLMNPAVAYGNPSISGKAGNIAEKYGRKKDPLTGRILGGHIIFGGGFGLYVDGGADKVILGGVGVSGDTACYDHSFGWIVRDLLGLDRVPNGVAAGTDNLIYDDSIVGGNSNTIIDGFEHVDCGFNEKTFVENLPVSNPVGAN